MTAPESEVRLAWRELMGRQREEGVERLLVRYAEPHRHYHTAVHIMWVLRHVDQLLGAQHVEPSLARRVRAAALFHDVVYEPTATDNEARSADYARRELTDAGWADDDVAAVVDLIAATDRHDPDCTLLGADILFDADLAILGSSPAEYSASVAAIRQEYAHVDDSSWRLGRANVLEQFLHRDPLFRTPSMRIAREAVAQANLSAELATLR